MFRSIRITTLMILVTSMSSHAQKRDPESDVQKPDIESVRKQVKEYYDTMDIDGDGSLSRDEVFTGFMGSWDTQVWTSIKKDDDDSLIDKSKAASEEFLKNLNFALGGDKKTFEDLDTNGDGEVSKEEARKMSEIGLEKTVFEGGDVNKDGIFTFDEFFDHLFGKKTTKDDEL